MNEIKTPNASYRLAVAIRYWHCARIILDNQIRPFEYMEPVGHLLNMTVELTLKSYLKRMGVNDKLLSSRNVGHDLGKLLQLSVERGLGVSIADARDILAMRTSHLEHFHRYGPKNIAKGYVIAIANDKVSLSLAARLIDIIGADPDKLRDRFKHSEKLEWPTTMVTQEPISLVVLAILAKDIERNARDFEAIGSPHS